VVLPLPLAGASVGDLLVVHDRGAYGASMSSNYNRRLLAAEVLVDAEMRATHPPPLNNTKAAHAGTRAVNTATRRAGRTTALSRRTMEAVGSYLPQSGRRRFMKTLFLVRHAKASRDNPALPDHERPLHERGHEDAPLMGGRLAQRHVKPDLIISSPAVRALSTAQAFAHALGYEPQRIASEARLYASTADTLLAVVRSLDKKLDCVMLFSHNPQLSELAQQLSGEVSYLNTCAVLELRYDTKSWSDIGVIVPSKVKLDAPKL
jgi:phosphohistidine phosphatase